MGNEKSKLEKELLESALRNAMVSDRSYHFRGHRIRRAAIIIKEYTIKIAKYLISN